MQIIEFLKVVILGIVEGITEWLPISSTGHMILVDEFIKLNASDAFKEMFFVVIQLGAIMAVIISFFRKLNPFSPTKNQTEKRDTFSLWYKIMIACIPAGIIGILFDDKLEELFYNYQTVAIMLILYGIFFIVLENRNKTKMSSINNLNELSYKTALLIGAFQMLALIPGTSRSGATILGAMLLGTSRFVAAEFSFFLAVPVMFGASGIKLVKYGFSYTPEEIVTLIVGMLVSFIVSVLAIKFLMEYIKQNDFKVFGYYRIVLGIIILGYFLIF